MAVTEVNLAWLLDWLESSFKKQFTYDEQAHQIRVVMPKNAEESDIMDDGMIGSWLVEHDFEVSLERGDWEYMTNTTALNRRAATYQKGHKAYLRNRIIMTITW